MRIVYHSPLFTHEGITKSSREYVKQIAKRHQVWLTQFPNTLFGKEFVDMYNSFDMQPDNHLLFLYGWTDKWHTHIGHRNIIGYNVYEGTNPPTKWIKNMNLPEVKQIWVPSNYVKEIYEKVGIKKPIEVIPHGIGKDYVCKNIDRSKFFNSIKMQGNPLKDKFIFFGMGAICAHGDRDRKGVDLLLQAFDEQFADNEHVALVLKLNVNYACGLSLDKQQSFDLNSYLGQWIRPGRKNVFVLIQDLDEKQLVNLYNAVDCAVFPHRSEGFGMCSMETAACGVPTITTGYSGTNDFSDENLRIKVKEMKLAETDNLDEQRYPYVGSYWAEPDLDHLKELMEKVYMDYGEQKQKAQKFGEEIHKKFSWDKIGEMVNEKLTKFAEQNNL